MSYTNTQRRQHIMELQRYLHALALMNGDIPLILPDGLYGPETSAAVRAFQENNGLNVTGTADSITWRRVVCAYRSILTGKPLPYAAFPGDRYSCGHGENGELVYVIQAMLRGLGKRYDNFPDVEVCGSYDDDTFNAVRYFQQLSGLPLTGKVDAATWNMMVKLT